LTRGAAEIEERVDGGRATCFVTDGSGANFDIARGEAFVRVVAGGLATITEAGDDAEEGGGGSTVEGGAIEEVVGTGAAGVGESLATGGSRLCGMVPKSSCTGRPVEPRGVSNTALNAGSATGVCGGLGPSRISTERARAADDSTSDLETSTGLPSRPALMTWCWISMLASFMAAPCVPSCANAGWSPTHTVNAVHPKLMPSSVLFTDQSRELALVLRINEVIVTAERSVDKWLLFAIGRS